ncbi:MAG: ATP-binding cassette domain-containing protein, partial [Acidobacteriota bacterium]
FKLLDVEPAILSPEKPKAVQLSGQIEFRDVSFSYTPGTPVLEEINLSIAAGEKVAIVGATGSGKSTLISLLCRFYEVNQGQILIDGVDIREIELDELRQAISVVLQDVFLFSGSIQENVRLWEKPISRQELEWAAEQVHAAPFIRNLPEGFTTALNERGTTLSVGQRQLLAFARALAHQPRILVLDEATSSVDTETELLIQDAVHRLMENRTSLIIAHRLSTIQDCDRIVVVHKGRIVEVGSHAELLAARGIYYKLYQLQYKDQLILHPIDTSIQSPKQA